MYLRGIESIQNKEVKRAICFLYKMPLCWEKMKLLVFIFQSSINLSIVEIQMANSAVKSWIQFEN